MQSAQTDNTGEATGQIIRSETTLREKCLRPGDSDDAAREAIARAERALDDLSVNFDDWMAIESKRLADARDQTVARNFSADTLQDLFQAAHNLKGQATTLGYPFADEICASLCRLIEKTLDANRLPSVLVDQHVDAVRALVNEGARGTDNPKASVLAKRLRDITNDFLQQEAQRAQAA